MTIGQEQTTAAMLTPAERAARGRAARGDAHLSNFGLFGSPERCLVFDLNDFDETLPGPFEGDVKRLAASLSVAGRDNGHDDAERRRVVLAATEAYRTAMAAFAGMGNLGVWYARLDVEEVLPPVRGRARPPARQGPAGQPGQGQGPRQRPGDNQAHQGPGGGAADRQPAAVDGALQELLPEVGAAELTEGLAGLLRRYAAFYVRQLRDWKASADPEARDGSSRQSPAPR